MNIIELIDENKYNIEQKLAGHGDFVCKIIEIRENELISVSSDKTMIQMIFQIFQQLIILKLNGQQAYYI